MGHTISCSRGLEETVKGVEDERLIEEPYEETVLEAYRQKAAMQSKT